MVLNQASQRRDAEEINKHAISERIIVSGSGPEQPAGIPVVDEHAKPDHPTYSLIDLIQPVYQSGLISEPDFKRISKTCRKPSAADTDHPALSRLQDVKVDLTTLGMITHFGLLDVTTKFYRIHISAQAHREIRQQLAFFTYQAETRQWHMDMWQLILNNPRFKFVPHTAPKDLPEQKNDKNVYLPFLSNFISRDLKTPLMTDDRVSQSFAFNEAKEDKHAAFGSDSFISALINENKLLPKDGADAIQQLMAWRYKFIVPSAEILKTIADQYKSYPPGHALQQVAEYVHDCMRDGGLFSGPEKTEMGESMAVRLYLTWSSIIADFIILVWADDAFTPENATRLTAWSVRELLPSLPRVFDGRTKTKTGSLTQYMFLSNALIKAGQQFRNPRMADALKAIKDALCLDNDEYHKIVMSTLDTVKTSAETKDIQEGLKRFQIRMRNYALKHFNILFPRSIIMLQKMGLLDIPAEPIGSDVNPEVFGNPNHPNRIKSPAGPLLFFTTSGDNRRTATELFVFLYSSLPEVRTAALACLKQMIADNTLQITPNTRNNFNKYFDDLNSDTPDKWQPAAVAVNDAFTDDVRVALQGLQQSLEIVPAFQEGLNSYAPKIIHPTVSSLDSIVLEVVNPENEHRKLAEIIAAIVNEAVSLSDACARYYARLGYLPLAPAFSMGEVVSQWMKSHPDTDAWTEIWSWARAAFGPIPKYHACTVFVLYPELVPDGKLPDLWREILDVVDDSGKNKAEANHHELWELRHELARHYICHLEANLPDNEGANIACFAWWLSEKVAKIFPDDPKAVKYYRGNWVEPAKDISFQIWLAASSKISRSSLRYTTLSKNSSPWTMALLALMGSNLEKLNPEGQSAETQALFHNSLVSNLIEALPVVFENSASPTYAMECALGKTAIKWATHQPEKQKNAVDQLIETNRLFNSIEELSTALRKLDKSSIPDQIAIAIALKSKACTDSDVASKVWEILSDAEWRQRVLGTVDVRVFIRLMEAFSILQVYNQDKWFSVLPHYMAELCEETGDSERRQHLFRCVILTSLASDTVSAVRQLLRGNHKAMYVEMVKDYRQSVEAMWPHYPAWVQGRMRSLLANLYVV